MNVIRNINTLKDTFDWTAVTSNQGFQIRTYRLMYILIGVQHNTNDNNIWFDDVPGGKVRDPVGGEGEVLQPGNVVERGRGDRSGDMDI